MWCNCCRNFNRNIVDIISVDEGPGGSYATIRFLLPQDCLAQQVEVQIDPAGSQVFDRPGQLLIARVDQQVSDHRTQSGSCCRYYDTGGYRGEFASRTDSGPQIPRKKLWGSFSDLVQGVGRSSVIFRAYNSIDKFDRKIESVWIF